MKSWIGKLAGKKEALFKSIEEFFHKRQNRKLVAVIAAVLIGLTITANAIFHYNRLSTWSSIVDARRANIDLSIQRRANLMPNLRKVVNKYIIHEQRLQGYGTDTSSLGVAASLQGSTLDMNNPFERTLSRMLFSWLMWPKLFATLSVQELMVEAVNTENMIAEDKVEFNKACATYNKYRLTFPGNFFGLIFGFKPVDTRSGKERMEAPSLDMKVPVLVSRPNGKIEDPRVTATDPISWLKAQYAKSQANRSAGKSGLSKGDKK